MKFDKLKERWQQRRAEKQRISREIEKIVIEKGRPIFKKYGIQEAILFGSVQEGRSRYGSDVDIFVQPLSVEKFWDCRRELEEAIGYQVDLHNEGDDSLFLKKIKKRGRKIYAV